MASSEAGLNSPFDKLLTKNVPHILEKIIFSLDYVSFMISKDVCQTWHQIITSERIQKRAKLIYTEDKSIYEEKLWHYSKDGNVREVGRLLSCGVNPNSLVEVKDFKYFARGKELPLLCASANGHKEVIKMLLDRGADVNATHHFGATALHWATIKDHQEVVEMLLERGADPDLADEDGYTPLLVATDNTDKDMVKLLLDGGADPDRGGVFTPLCYAAEGGESDIVQMLLDAGADPNLSRWSAYSPFHIASEKGHTDVVRLFLEEGADPNLTNSSGETPLHCAASKGHEGIVEMLLDAGADHNMITLQGQSPLKIAALNVHMRVVKILVDKGAKPNEEEKAHIKLVEYFQALVR